MREAINTGVKAAKGKLILRSDEHCMFADGFDKEMVGKSQKFIEDGWAPSMLFTPSQGMSGVGIHSLDHLKDT